MVGVVPRRSAWPELQGLDDRIGEFQRRHTEAQELVRGLMEQRASSPTADADALATWELAGRKGPKPEPTADTLDRQVADAERDRDGLERAIDVTLEQKASHVEKHRARLVKVATQQADDAHARMLALVDELEQTRASLIELRAAAVWASLFPNSSAAGEPPTTLIARGLAEPITVALGLRPPPQIQAAKLLELLRADADALKAAATAEQRAAMEGRDPNRRATGATWANTPEGEAAARQDKAEQIAAYRETWGVEPPEWT